MAKLKITIMVEVEYEPKPESYTQNNGTPEEMLAIDLEGVKDDPYLFLMDSEGAEWTITGEVIEK